MSWVFKTDITKGVSCSYNNLTELVIPEGCEVVYCYNNQLTELVIPDGCEYVYCWNNNLSELILPDSCQYVACDIYLADNHFDEWLNNDTKIFLQ